MNRRYYTIILIALAFSIIFNIFQYEKIKEYRERDEFYNEAFTVEFNNLIDSFEFYNGNSLSNESAIKNSVNIISSLEEMRPLTSYKHNKHLSEMLHNLSKFFVLKSNKEINKHIGVIEKNLKDIVTDLNNDNKIIKFNVYLRDLKQGDG